MQNDFRFDICVGALSDSQSPPIEQNTCVQVILDFLLFLVLFVTPWLICTELKEVFNTPKDCWIGIVAVLMGILEVVDTVGRGEIQIPRYKALGFLGILAVWMTVSLGWSACVDVAVRDWGYHMALFVIFGSALLMVHSRERMENLLHFAIAAGVIVAGFATLQYYGFDEPIFKGLSQRLYHEKGRDGSGATGLFANLFSPETARLLHYYLDPAFLVLPGKPDEATKNYSFMGHRNYLAGYLIALIPLVLSRLLAHLDVYLKVGGDCWRKLRDGIPAGQRPLFARGLLGMGLSFLTSLLMPRLGIVTLFALFALVYLYTSRLWLLVAGAIFTTALVLTQPPPMVIFLTFALVLSMAAIFDSLLRSIIVYLASVVLMFHTVLLSHTRGAWIGLIMGIPFLVVVLCAKEIQGIRRRAMQQGLQVPAFLPGGLTASGVARFLIGTLVAAGVIVNLVLALYYPLRAVEGMAFVAVVAALLVHELKEWSTDPTHSAGAPGPSPEPLDPVFLKDDIVQAPHLFVGNMLIRLLILSFCLWIKVHWVETMWSWLPILIAFVEFVGHYAIWGFKANFLHRRAVILTLVPLVLNIVAVVWKEIPYFDIKNPLNREPTSALSRLDDTFKFHEASSTHQRWLIYKTTWDIITESSRNWFIGTGIGTFGMNYMPYQSRVLGRPENASLVREVNKSIYAHDEYLHYWSETGVIGMHLFMLAGICYLAVVLRNLFHCELDYETLLYVGMLSSIISVMAHIFFSFCLHLAYTASLFYCLIAFTLRFFPCPLWRFSWNPGHSAAASREDLVVVAGQSLTVWGQLQSWVRVMLPAGARPEKGASPAALAPLTLSITDPRGGVTETKPGAIRDYTSVVVDGEVHPVAQHVVTHEGTPGVWQYAIHSGGDKVAAGQVDVPPPSILPLVLASILAMGVGFVTVRSIINVALGEYHWRNAFLKFRLQKFEESMLDFTKSLDADPQKGEILFDFGRTLMDSQRNEMAIRIFEKATVSFVDPANYHNIALCWYKEANRARDRGLKPQYEVCFARTEAAYRKALELNLIYEQSLANLIYLLMDKAGEDPPKAKQYLAEAETLARAGCLNYRGNLQFWTAYGVILARQERGQDAVLALLRGLIPMLQGRVNRRKVELKNDASALAALSTTADKASKLYEVGFKKYMRALWEKNVPPAEEKTLRNEAEAAYLESTRLYDSIPSINLDATADKIRLNVAMILQARPGQQSLALETLDRVTDKSDPTMRTRFLSLAVAYYTKMQADGPLQASAFIEYAKRLAAWAYESEAAKVLYKLLEFDKTNKEGLFLLADCLHRQRYYDEALKEYKRLLSSLPPGDELVTRIRDRIDVVELDRTRSGAAAPATTH